MKTNVTKTSIKAHQKNVAKGVYQPKQAAIISALKRVRKPLTRQELAVMTGIGINSVCGRVKDLLDSKTLEVKCEKRCSITGSNVQGIFLA